jgi:hypothetical protein
MAKQQNVDRSVQEAVEGDVCERRLDAAACMHAWHGAPNM